MCGVWLYLFLKCHILHQQSVWGHSLTFRLCPKVGQLGQTWRQTSQTVMSTVFTANAPWTPTIGISSPPCLHMNSHHTLSTHVTGQSSPHHRKPLSTPTPPLSSPELSRVPRNRVTARAISVKPPAALLHHPPCNLQGKSTTHTDLESQHEQTWGFLWKINKSNGLSKRMERLCQETSEFLIRTKQSDSWTGSSTLV